MFFIRKVNQKINEYVNKVNSELAWSNDNNLDEYYIFNKAYYKENYEFYKNLECNFAMQFPLIIPFDLPFSNKVYTKFYKKENGNKISMTLIFSKISERREINAGLINYENCNYEKIKTRCEVVFIFEKPEIDLDDGKYNILDEMRAVKEMNLNKREFDNVLLKKTRKIFQSLELLQNTAIHNINSMIVSYGFNNNDFTVSTISKRNIDFLTHFRGIEIGNWKTYNWMDFNNIVGYPEEKKDDISDEIFAQTIGHARELETNPFFIFFVNLQNSKYKLSKGNFTSAIVDLNTSSEILIRLIVYLYWENEEKLSVQEVNERVEDTSFKKMVKLYLPLVLGGSWGILKSNTIAGDWYMNAYRLRNRIVHAGYDPSDKEIFNSIDITNRLHEYLFSLIEKSKYTYLKQIMMMPNIELKNIT